MSAGLDPAVVSIGADEDRDPFCGHEFDDGGLCADDAVADTGRCPGHQDDGQPDRRTRS